VKFTDAPVQPQNIQHVKSAVKDTQDQDHIVAPQEFNSMNLNVNRYYIQGLQLK